MEIDYEDQLHQDFLIFLDMCKDPDIAFPPKSNESNLAKQWINHLCTYAVENLNDRRLKNMYMSHLCAALIDGKLKGPFLQLPTKGKLEKIDFNSAEQLSISATMHPTCSSQILPSYEMNDINMAMAMNKNPHESAGHESQAQISVDSMNLAFNTTLPDSCLCPPQPCQCGRVNNCCTCNRATAGAESTTTNCHLEEDAICKYLMKTSPEFLNDFNTSLTSFINLCNISSIECKTQLPQSTQSQLSADPPLRQTILQQSLPLLVETKATSSNLPESSIDHIPSTLTFPDYDNTRKNMTDLLEAISAELRGDVDAGSNDFLESELSRYKDFIMDHSNLATCYRTLTSDWELRNSLLLNLQNDLVKLLNDNFL